MSNPEHLSGILERVSQQSHGTVLYAADGATLELLKPPNEDDQLCVMKGIIPPGGVVPMHSHDDTEEFLVLSGSQEVLLDGPDGPRWHRVTAGDYVHVERGARHAWRNDTDEPVVDLLVMTKRMGEFFLESSERTPNPGPPSPEQLARLVAVAARYGFWLASPEENAAVGIELPPLPSPAGDGAAG